MKNITGPVLLAACLIMSPGCYDSSAKQTSRDGARCTSPSASLVRQTTGGMIEGREWDDATRAWLGVPYAKPPVGGLRWRAPQDPSPWEGVRPADSFCSECTQISGILLTLDPSGYKSPTGSEDCLYLNIWRPRTDDENLPVFVWVHGGMNSAGEAATSLYHGANLAAKGNMVVVTVNYRLGPLGWFLEKDLESGDPLDDSGNYGLLDIIKALTWVRDNIAAFGGDAGNVMLAGESAGGFNVISLMASPLAKGLFHRAMAMSPASSAKATSPGTGRLFGRRILVKLMLKDGTARCALEAEKLIMLKGRRWVADYLRSKDAGDIVQCATTFDALGMNDIGLLLETAMGGRYEDGTVIPSGYDTIFADGNYNKVPLIIGSNLEEMKILLVSLGIMPGLDEREIRDLIVNFDPGSPSVTFNGLVPPLQQGLFNAMGMTGGDKYFQGTGVDPAAAGMSLHQNVYVYKFRWNHQPAPFDELIGASHMMMIPFVFGNFQTDTESLFRFAWCEANMTGVEDLSGSVMAYISAFARTGDPNSGNGDLAAWRPWSNGDDAVNRLYLGDELYMGK